MDVSLRRRNVIDADGSRMPVPTGLSPACERKGRAQEATAYNGLVAGPGPS